MEKFIPYEKLSKKKKRELDTMKRGSWGGLNPVTRKPKNPKAYDRRKAQSWKKDSGPAPFVYSFFAEDYHTKSQSNSSIRNGINRVILRCRP